VRTPQVILVSGAIIAILLIAYLLIALLAPEKFQ
jgi:K+-transporting ATPase KdpF subunit